MATGARTTRERMTAEDRRDQIISVAVSEFAKSGLHGTSTETIAQRAGVSQPYLFRLFGTKRDLFIAACERCFDHVAYTFTAAAEGSEEPPLVAMGHAYVRLVSSREDLLMQLQSYAASGDEVVREIVSRRYEQLFNHVKQLSGESPDRVRDFFACGMLLNITLATGTERLITKEWLTDFFDGTP